MTKRPSNSDLTKSKALVLFEYVLLVLCLCVIALRCTFTEGPTVQTSTTAGNLWDSVYSLSVSAVLIFSCVVWFVWSLCTKRFRYRLTGIETGLVLFSAAAVVSGLAATDKRLAITDFAVLVAPALMALLLVQILDGPSKIKLVLCVIGALGVVSAYEGTYQFLHSNQVTIEQYEKEPQSMLGPFGIEPNTFQHFLFEHRLYSKGVRGFFTTRNSAGSFALMAFFAAAALFIEKLKYREQYQLWPLWLVFSAIAAGFILLGLVITRSKGAIIGLLFASVVFAGMLGFGEKLKTHRKAILIVCLLAGLAGACVVVWYGLNHDRLPGGNSMLVRWQYWHASAKMYADYPLTGVGPGNFAHFYTHYKPDAALESVADPHNFPLSILTQYGPLGLVGFLAMIFIPLWRTIAPGATNTKPKIYHHLWTFIVPAVVCLIVVSTALRVIRPLILQMPLDGSPEENKAAITNLYVIPVRLFIFGFLLLAAGWKHRQRGATTIPGAALFCAVLGVALHNLIDFAIFEPGVLTSFWAMIACLIAMDSYTEPRPPLALRKESFGLKPAPFVRLSAVAVGVVLVWAYFNYALIPTIKSTSNIQQANQAISTGQFGDAHKILDTAAKDDLLSPAALSMNGRLYLHHFEMTGNEERNLLLESEKCLLAAIERNNAAFKNFERLTEVYSLLAENSTQQEKDAWMNKAFDAASQAVERYGGCARLRIERAKIAEQLGKTEIAIGEYQKTIDIEDKYRSQFQEIYPEREEVVSRLGKDKYLYAKDQLKSLREQ